MNIRAVIAEDDFRVADIHEKFLRSFKEIQVVAKTLNAQDTLDILRKEKPNLLILDVYLPDQLGTDILPIIREEFPEIDIIMVTATTDKKLFEKALHYGVEGFLLKPVKMERFYQSIEEYLNKAWLMQSNQEVDQDFVDLIYKNAPVSKKKEDIVLPKGIDEITLSKVRTVLEDSQELLSSERLSIEIGASRTTARRYLEYLISVKECKAEVVYGAIGRPERRYSKVD